MTTHATSTIQPSALAAPPFYPAQQAPPPPSQHSPEAQSQSVVPESAVSSSPVLQQNSAVAVEQCRCVMINHIPESITGLTLRNMFLPFGGVEAAKIMVDPDTGNSLGYGYVKFHEADSTLEAIKCLNGFPIEDKFVKVSLARIPDEQLVQLRSIYIENLPAAYSESEVLALFKSFGSVSDSKVLLDDKTGRCNGFAFIEFARERDARKAVQNMSGQNVALGQQPLIVKLTKNKVVPSAIANFDSAMSDKSGVVSDGQSEPSQPAQQGRAQAQGANLQAQADAAAQAVQAQIQTQLAAQVSNQMKMLQDQQLRQQAQFQQQMLLLREQAAAAGLDPSAVTLNQQQQQQQQQQQLHQQMQHQQAHQQQFQMQPHLMGQPHMPNMIPGQGSQLTRDLSGTNPNYVPKTMYQPTNKSAIDYANQNGGAVFVFHLPIDATDELLYTLFSPCGQLLSTRVIMNRQTGTSKGYGFVNFASLDDAKNSVLIMNGFQIGNKYLKVSLKK